MRSGVELAVQKISSSSSWKEGSIYLGTYAEWTTKDWCSEWWTERRSEEGLAENGWMMLKIGVTWIYTLSAGWLRIDYYGDML